MQIKKIILFIFIGILLFIIILSRVSKKSLLSTSNSSLDNVSSLSKKDNTIENFMKFGVDIVYRGDKNRNPFQSPFDAVHIPKKRQLKTTKPTVKRKISYSFINDIKLQGIIVTPTGSKVIIDDKIKGEGETIHGAKITKIGKEYVILNYEGRTFKKILNY